jgi:FKBP-type peptidyl-prolyl cis-trans isomerase FklB
MHRLSTSKMLSLIISLAAILLSACSTKLDIPYKGPELNSLEQAANYITSKNVCKKLVTTKVHLLDKPFLLGAYDVRDDIAPRVPEDSYGALLDNLQKNASLLLNAPEATPVQIENAPEGLRTVEERASYLTGRAIAKSFGKNGIPVMPASMAIGLADAQTKDAPKISAKEEKDLVAAIKEKIDAKDNDWAENRKNFYIAQEKAFFADNIVKPDVISLPTGVQYKIVAKGSGKNPKPKDKVTVNYKGTLLDGTEFDSSYARKKPDTFKLTDMITGFSQAMTQVPEGSKVIMYIPSSQAYGEKGNDIIPPYAALIFEVELIGVK